MAAASQAGEKPVQMTPSGQRWAPLRHWPDSALAEIAGRLSGLFDAWAGEWTISPECVNLSREVIATSVLSRPALGTRLALPLHTERAIDAHDVEQAWLCFGAPAQFARFDPLAQLGLRMTFGVNCKAETGSVATDLGTAALEALVSSICAVLGMTWCPLDEKRLLGELPHAQFHPLAGGVKMVFPFADDVALFLNGAAAQKLVSECATDPARPVAGGLIALRDAASAEKVSLDARLNPVELTFGEIKFLQVGDVVILPHLLEEPLQLVTEFDTRISEGFLGRLEDRRAIQVVRRRPAGDAVIT